MLPTASNAATATLSATDLNKPEVSTFVFTSPTSTFKRKKQQQLLKEQEQELHNNNLTKKGQASERPIGINEGATNLNEDYSNSVNGSKGSLSNTALLRHHWGTSNTQQHYLEPESSPQQQLQNRLYHYRSNNPNDTQTVINTGSSTGVIITDPSVATLNYPAASSSTSSLIASGNGTTTTTTGSGNGSGSTTTRFTTRRTHTLPLTASATSKTTKVAKAACGKLQLPSSFLADGVVDLVHDTKCATVKSSTSSPPPPPHSSILPLHPAHSNLKSNSKTKSSTSTSGSSKRHGGNKNSKATHQSAANKMQASSSGGSGTTTTAKGFSNTSSLVDDIEMNLGLIGWRKKCLYTLLVLLMLLIIVNLGLTLWILKVMEFSTVGKDHSSSNLKLLYEL